MKIKILEYQRYKSGIIKVKSHKKVKGKWKENKNFKMHKKLIELSEMCPIIFKKEYEVEVN